PAGPFRAAAWRIAGEVYARRDDAVVARKGDGGDRVVAFMEATAEMQAEHLAAVEVEHGRARIAAERRHVMGRGCHRLSEARRIDTALQLAGLQFLDAVASLEDVVLN